MRLKCNQVVVCPVAIAEAFEVSSMRVAARAERPVPFAAILSSYEVVVASAAVGDADESAAVAAAAFAFGVAGGTASEAE